MSAEYPGAEWIPNSNFFVDRNGEAARYIIVHGTAGGTNAADTAVYFQSTQGTANPVSSHFIVGRDGHVVQCIYLKDGAWANGGISQGADPWWNPNINPNNITVSIEFDKPSTDNSDSLSPEQEQAGFALIAWLCKTLNIPARQADASGGITGHFSIDPVNRSHCPGAFDFSKLWSFLGGRAMGIPSGWHDDGTTLTAPNGHRCILGFREYILNNPWNAEDFPLEEEHGQTPLEQSNTALGAGTQQVFRMSVLEWTTTRGVFQAWCGQELLWYRQHANGVSVHPDVIDDIRILYGNAQKLKADAGL